MFFHSATLLASLALVKFSTAGYVLEDDYSPENFFNMFTFFTDTDPTNGFGKPYSAAPPPQSSRSTDLHGQICGSGNRVQLWPTWVSIRRMSHQTAVPVSV